jgi:hypothetical protein
MDRTCLIVCVTGSVFRSGQESEQEFPQSATALQGRISVNIPIQFGDMFCFELFEDDIWVDERCVSTPIHNPYLLTTIGVDHEK